MKTVSDSMSQLSKTHKKLENYDKAIEFNKKSLGILQKLYGDLSEQ